MIMAAMASPSSIHPPRVGSKGITLAYRADFVVSRTQYHTILRLTIPSTQVEGFHE